MATFSSNLLCNVLLADDQECAVLEPGVSVPVHTDSVADGRRSHANLGTLDEDFMPHWLCCDNDNNDAYDVSPLEDGAHLRWEEDGAEDMGGSGPVGQPSSVDAQCDVDIGDAMHFASISGMCSAEAAELVQQGTGLVGAAVMDNSLGDQYVGHDATWDMVGMCLAPNVEDTVMVGAMQETGPVGQISSAGAQHGVGMGGGGAFC